MRKDRKARVLSIIAVIIGIIGISISYASLSTTLIVGETLGLEKGANWYIHFSNLSDAKLTGNAEEKKSPVIKDDTTIGNFDVTFKSQNDSIEYSFDIVNDGTIDAKLTTLNFLKPICTSSTNKISESDLTNVCNSITYSLKTDEGNQINIGNELFNKKSIRVKLIIKYTGTFLPTEVITINGLGVVLLYSQN